MMLYRRRRRGRAGDILVLGALAAVLAATAMLVSAIAALIAVVSIVTVVAAGLILAVPALRRALSGGPPWFAPRGTSGVDPSSRTAAGVRALSSAFSPRGDRR